MRLGSTNLNNYNSLALAGSYGAYSQKLTAPTKNKLIQLGIAFDENTTEAEGKKLIQEAQNQKLQKNENSQDLNKDKNNNQQGRDAFSNDLFERAKKLAQSLGIAVDNSIDFYVLLEKIEETLEANIQAAQNNPDKLGELKSLSQELSSIQAEANGSMSYNNSNKALMESLQMLSEYNKNMLHFNT